MLFGYFYSDLIWLLILEVCYAYYPLRFFHTYYLPNTNLCYLPICIPIACGYWIYRFVTRTTASIFSPKIIDHACVWICRNPHLNQVPPHRTWRDKLIQSLISTPACSAPLSTSVQLHLCRSRYVWLPMYSVLHASASMPASYSCPWGQFVDPCFQRIHTKLCKCFLGP
jgi:hypothetical protein